MNLQLNHLKGIYAISIFLLAISIPLNAATYYVDFANGNDNNNGITTTTAFKHAPGDPQAAGLAGGTILQAGDVVQFKSGVEYKGQVLLSRNGTSSSYIEYRGQGWGTGRSTFNLEYIREYAFKGGVDYIKITGFNLYYYPVTGTDYVVYPTTGASNWIIDSVSIAYLKDWNNVSVFPDKVAILLSNSTSNIVISNSEFFASGRTTIKLRYVSYVTIKNCDFGGINRGNETGWFSVALRGEVTCNNIHIEDNKFHDGWQYGGDQVPELNHAPAFIHMYGADATTHPYQIYIERNYFYNDKYFAAGSGTGTLEMETYLQDVYIRNNIFANACQNWGSQLLIASGCNNIYIYNNTFIDRPYVVGYGINCIKVYLNSTPVGNNVIIKNNIFWSDANSSGDCCVDFHGSATFQGTIDHNAYFRSNPNKVNVFNDAVVSWATWQGHGLDVNSNLYNLAEPSFTYIPPSGAATSSGDYSLSSAAVNLIDKGITLTGFNDSYNGVIRPEGAAWDLGAFEYISQVGGNNPPDQPSNPDPQDGSINQPLELTLNWTCADPDGDPLTYDVYFGNSVVPPLVSSNQTNSNFNTGQLNGNTPYYWKIIAKDNHSASTSGPVWNFNTLNPDTTAGSLSLLNVKVLLEGPFDGNEMSTDLANYSLVPLTQPYSTTPWNYNGNEEVNAIPQNIVDWILLELRTGTGPSTVVIKRAALLRNDGQIVDLNGEPYVNFPGIENGAYYIVIYHRNHLAIMSKNAILLSDTTSLYDFTSSEDKAYGNLAMKLLGNGKYGLYAADGNGNGSVNNADYRGVWKKENGLTGYEDGDFDLNGGVNIVDRNSKWRPNEGQTTRVPMN